VGSHSEAKERYAIDFGTQYNLLLASTDGWVRLAKGNSKTGGCSPGYGALANYVVLYWADGSGRESLYLHLSKLDAGIKEGAYVKRGAPIGYSGDTGYTCGAHLHYQVQKGARGPNDRASHWWLTSVKAPFVEGHPEKPQTMKSQNSPTDSVSVACQKPALDLAIDEKPLTASEKTECKNLLRPAVLTCDSSSAESKWLFDCDSGSKVLCKTKCQECDFGENDVCI
jgi:murein DD-endopeptidase MepM/ murein hydrolase activator NlpD